MLKHSPLPWTIEPGDEPEDREIWDANLAMRGDRLWSPGSTT